MGAPLKDSFGPDVATRIAHSIAAVWDGFRVPAFVAEALDGFEELELTPRARHIARALHNHLPSDYDKAIDLLLKSIGPREDGEELSGMAAFYYAPHIFFVAEYGIEHWESSMRAQYEITQRFTAEYSIRVFLERYPERTLARLREWAADPSPDVRRLVSEGTRPRLPWAPRLRAFQVDPSPVLDLLEILKDDPSEYVRRSVANNLNDIGKDHLDLLVSTCRRWIEDATSERRWLIRHALRSAIKSGNRSALEVLGFGGAEDVKVGRVEIDPRRPSIGTSVRISFHLRNVGSDRAAFNVDLRVHFVKANRGASPKVFKVREIELNSGERASLSKLISLRQHTTRKHHPGTHTVEVIVNGVTMPGGSFDVVA
jgi:3-methyladenine DNA glycosylase AlkC